MRDERLAQIDGQIKASSTYIDSLGTRLGALQERAMQFKPYSSDANARRMPDDLAEELVRTANEARNQREALDAKRKEQAEMRAQFEADIAALPGADREIPLLTRPAASMPAASVQSRRTIRAAASPLAGVAKAAFPTGTGGEIRTISSATCTTGTTTSCAMRSPGWIS